MGIDLLYNEYVAHECLSGARVTLAVYERYMMADDHTQINIRLQKEQKERWDRVVENHPVFSDLSSFIRHCVKKEIDEEELDEEELDS